MKIINKKNRKLIFCIFNIILYSLLITSTELKLRYKLHKNHQVLLGRPPQGQTVVSPLTEAEEMPFHSVIDVAVRQQPIQMFNGQAIPVQHMIPQAQAYSSPVSMYTPQAISMINSNAQQRYINNPSSAYNTGNNLNIMLHDADSNFLNGNVDKSFEIYANALVNANGQSQENQILQNVAHNLHDAPANLANKLEERVLSQGNNNNSNNNKQDLVNKIKHLMQENNDLDYIDNTGKAQNKHSEQNEDIISLEPKKRILRLENNNNASSVNKNKASLINDLVTWAKENKITMRKLKINPHFKQSGESSIISGEKVKKNDKILIIPNNLVISINNPNIKTLCGKLKQIKYFKTNYDKICLTVYLLTNNDDNLKPFIEFMNENTNFNSFPFFYNKRELKLLEGSYFSSLIAGREEAMNFEYKVLIEDKIITRSILKEEYFKARINVMSKNFSLKDGSGQVVSVLVPFAELLNHNSSKANVRLNLTNKGVDVVSLGVIKKNEHIYASYGGFSNYHYLLYYGFVEQNNSIPIQINLDLKIKNGTGNKKYEEVMLSPDMKINITLKIFRRIVNNFNTKTTKTNNYENPISLLNELESLRLLKNGLKTQISRYPTTLTQDLRKLITSQGDRNALNIFSVLIEEKKIIIKYYNASLIFYKMIKKVSEKNESLALTEKISKLIERRKYLKSYFSLIKNIFHLEIEMSSGEKNEEEGGDNLDIEENEFQSEGEAEFGKDREINNIDYLNNDGNGNNLDYGEETNSDSGNQESNHYTFENNLNQIHNNYNNNNNNLQGQHHNINRNEYQMQNNNQDNSSPYQLNPSQEYINQSGHPILSDANALPNYNINNNNSQRLPMASDNYINDSNNINK